MAFLPVSKKDMADKGWDQLDFLYISGDAYVDHPSFGHSIITRVLESEGYKVGIIAQPDWRSKDAFLELGRPRHAVLVSSGVIDSMVNHYTAGRKPRSEDNYSPGGKSGKRPDRAVTVYCNRIREAFRDIPLIIGGLEASLRRFAHYDYWDDKVRRSVLIDSKADILIYGMGEKPIVEIASLLSSGVPIREIKNIRGTAYSSSLKDLPLNIKASLSVERLYDFSQESVDNYNGNLITTDFVDGNPQVLIIPSFEEVSKDKDKYAKAFMHQYNEQDSINGRILVQSHADRYLVQNPPAYPLTQKQMDSIYALPYERTYHPAYEKDSGVPALNEVEFSLTSHRGCYGGCSFCALNFHQGRVIQQRSHSSILNEARKLTWQPNFKGYIHDIGGPTANFRNTACEKQKKHGVCKGKQCLHPEACKNLIIDHSEYLELLRKLRELPDIKKVFIRSGIRYDYLMLDKSDDFFIELCKHHVSGQLKVAPEHVSDRVLDKMGKPGRKVYERFVKKFYEINKKLGKEQFLVPYLVSSHPGSDMNAAIELAVYLKESGYYPEQVQDFYPTPGTLSTTMFYTGLDPRTMKKVYVPRDPAEKAMQRALLQFNRKENYRLVKEALTTAGRLDLIGFGPGSLIRPEISAKKTNHGFETSKNKKVGFKQSNRINGRQKVKGAGTEAIKKDKFRKIKDK